MRNLTLFIILLCLVVGSGTFVCAKSQTGSAVHRNTVKHAKPLPASTKGVKVPVSDVFKVQNVTFKTISLNNKTHLVAGIVFNKHIDASSVVQNVNIRMLRKNEQHFWLDASTQNNIVRIRQNTITWVCGKPLESSVYVMHLRGTMKSSDGVSLDCNGDGKGEGGSLPAFESQLYQSSLIPQHKDLDSILGELRDQIDN